MKPPPRKVIVELILSSWNDISCETIRKSFKSYALTTALDGDEDDQIHCFKINDLCSPVSLRQLIEEYTSVSPHSRTLLDLIIDPGFSDHSVANVIRKFKWLKGEPKIIKVRCFRNFLEDGFLRDLRNSD